MAEGHVPEQESTPDRGDGAVGPSDAAARPRIEGPPSERRRVTPANGVPAMSSPSTDVEPSPPEAAPPTEPGSMIPDAPAARASEGTPEGGGLDVLEALPTLLNRDSSPDQGGVPESLSTIDLESASSGGGPAPAAAVTAPETPAKVGSTPSGTARRSVLNPEDAALGNSTPQQPLTTDAPPPSQEVAAPPPRVLPGHTIAQRYEVTDILGEGGMGIVYRCRDVVSREYVALKRVIPPDGPMAQDYINWFYKEARALAALGHPNIVGARDFGVLVDGSPYLVMDLVDGVSLHDLLAASVPFPIIWSAVDQVLAALAHAHARGVIHGDLKPSNVIVEERDGPPRVHILDFGLAWLREETHDTRLDGAKAPEWAPHAGAGTPGYMAPEQVLHEMHHVCGATDLYALGCALYKLLGGTPPFTGDSRELLRAHAYEQIPPLKLAIDAPRGVTSYVHRLLAKRAWERWEFAAEARREWAKFRPKRHDADVYRFPRVSRRQPPADAQPTRKPHPAVRDVPAARDRAPGLLSMRQSPLVGREDVRLMLRRICTEVAGGVGSPHRLVILVGPAGVGKSRIAQWLCEMVHEEGRMIPLKARYRPMRSPLDGMLGAVTQYYNFERTDRETVEQSLLSRWSIGPRDKNGRAWVAGAAEWIRPTPPGTERPVGPSGMRFTLDTLETRRLAIRYTLRRISRGRPLLFWLDDLHHAAGTTFEGLLRIHEQEPDQRLVMVATVRSEDVQLNAKAAERLRTLREALGGDVVEVHPLDANTTANLLRESLPLDDAAVKEAARRARGNPLFALQQLHAWAVSGHMSLDRGLYQVPDEVLRVRPKTTAELWDSRVSAMEEGHRLAAFAASTLGSDIRRGVLIALFSALGLPPAEALSTLQNAEILLPRGPGRYTWPHALLQEHLLGRLAQRDDANAIFTAAADALKQHPLANTRRVVRQRVANVLNAGTPDIAAEILFDFIQSSWNGAREPLATLAELELLRGHLQGKNRAVRHRWQAEALRHVGRAEDAEARAQTACEVFEEIGDFENLAATLRLLGHLASERGNAAEGRNLALRAHEMYRDRGDILGQAQTEAVLGEIAYLLGDFEKAREFIGRAEGHFAAMNQPLGRGQCLLLHSWIDHSEGATERSRRLTQEARSEFERAGYRLGIAQADASLAHIEHRLMNYYSAERGAQDALVAFENLRTLRGQAACERLLAMVGIDTDDLDQAELHAERARDIYERMGDPWGVLEARLLVAQVHLTHDRLDEAAELLDACDAVKVEEAEPRQHLLLTRAWYSLARGDTEAAIEALDDASVVFSQRARVGDHAPHLVARLSRLTWPDHARDRVLAWLALLNDRTRRHLE